MRYSWWTNAAPPAGKTGLWPRPLYRYGIKASQLAGLHAHFLLATAEHARPSDIGVLITSAEWLHVN